ncbi:hypothetical protein M670_03577 [Schinkia azotoformans MEV2011]|uniref:DNA-binding protein n=2 Tax=Schinkia azotoformans TaxID=1454 RepID=K6CBY4_SCHAZ|nr:helix-turn-helix domain-containing protein [Schinkia azotoformans]EKN68625.1 DNA-binding protein [Schinkia azotoformans LMG 9581]KEF37156.1 hypothetical protein M670_03577 [Schinkia azotoformans MEV2011]MEC1637648.1 helix-turn-helix domain-containing protein [Schinkia azotoformans]MEC1695434.1 helix-turn-helix domain-containing protein [Schinkia azotoformans]MEC1715441.1 helix-turn-helix domain-containing protein [Schinkia azotoformans]
MLRRKLFRNLFGKTLRQKRYEGSKKKLTLSEFVSKTDLDDSYIGKIERGEKLPDALTLYKIFVGRGISIDQLFNDMKPQFEMLVKLEKR